MIPEGKPQTTIYIYIYTYLFLKWLWQFSQFWVGSAGLVWWPFHYHSQAFALCLVLRWSYYFRTNLVPNESQWLATGSYSTNHKTFATIKPFQLPVAYLAASVLAKRLNNKQNMTTIFVLVFRCAFCFNEFSPEGWQNNSPANIKIKRKWIPKIVQWF